MRKVLLAVITLAVALGFYGTPVQAGVQFNGVDIFVTGERPPLDNWSPGTSSTLQLKDDGVAPDTGNNDNIYTCQTTLSGNVGWKYSWKMASNGWGQQCPLTGDAALVYPAGGVITFFFNANTRGDGFLPDAGTDGAAGVVYTTPRLMSAADTLRVTMDFTPFGGGNWDATDNHGLMYDDGTHGDTTPGDGIFATQLTGFSSGTKAFKITANGTWDRQISRWGYGAGGGDIQFSVLATSDIITFQVNTTYGTYKVTNNNPLSHAGPPFFACGVVKGSIKNIPWSEAMTEADTQLWDDASHGDLVASDGIYSRVFDGPTTPGMYGIQVKQGVGQSYPDSGPYPIQTTIANQKVFVQFDTNSYSDSAAKPDSRVIWVNSNARFLPSPAYVQALGDFMMDLGGGGNWSNTDTNFEQKDDGLAASGDLVAGDGIYTWKFTATATLTSKNVKAVGKSGSWDYQFGGVGEGYTYNGDNDPKTQFSVAIGETFFIQTDTVTGRVKVNTGSAAATLVRPSTIKIGRAHV